MWAYAFGHESLSARNEPNRIEMQLHEFKFQSYELNVIQGLEWESGPVLSAAEGPRVG